MGSKKKDRESIIAPAARRTSRRRLPPANTRHPALATKSWLDVAIAYAPYVAGIILAMTMLIVAVAMIWQGQHLAGSLTALGSGLIQRFTARRLAGAPEKTDFH